MNMSKQMYAAAISIVLLLFGRGFLFAESADAIMARIDAKQSAKTSQSRMIMRIYPNGYESDVREYHVESFGRGEDESYMVFVEPRSIRGLRVLEVGDDIRVYFPSTGRIRRITGNQKSGSVGGVGGDFSYEDAGSGSYCEDYHLSMDGEDGACWIIRGVPLDPDSTYSHVLFFVEKGTDRLVKVEYFTPENGHTKTLNNSGFRTAQGVEMPTTMVMINHKDSQKTIVEITAARYNMDIDEKYFNPNRFYR